MMPFWVKVKSIILTTVAPFWATFGKLGLLFISTSGHTAALSDALCLYFPSKHKSFNSVLPILSIHLIQCDQMGTLLL